MLKENQFVQSKAAGLSIIEPSLIFVNYILNNFKFNSIIDFGCGFGCHLTQFAQANKMATGVDVYFTDEAKEDAKKFGYALIEDSWTNIKEETFDVGFSHHCLEHARDPIQWLHEWGKIIKTGGYIFLTLPSYRPEVLAGHITNGWNPAQLAYNLSVAGFDCTEGLFTELNGNVYGIAKKGVDFQIHDTHVFGFGTCQKNFPKTMRINSRGVMLEGELVSFLTQHN